MNIAISYGSTVLCAATDAVSNWRLDGNRLAQVVQGLRSANIKSYDRRNGAHTLSFTVTRAPAASSKAALVFLGTHQTALDAVTGVVDLTVTLTPATAATMTLKNATLTRVSSRIVGATTLHDYEFTGGLLINA